MYNNLFTNSHYRFSKGLVVMAAIIVLPPATGWACACGCGIGISNYSQWARGHNHRPRMILPLTLAAQEAESEVEEPPMTTDQATSDFPVQSPSVPPSAPAGMVQSNASSVPGMYVDPNVFIVLTSRLGRQQELQPMRDPNDDKEAATWITPEAWERGTQLRLEDLYQGPAKGYDNGVHRLLMIGAIGHLDHEDAQNAINELNYRHQIEGSHRPANMI